MDNLEILLKSETKTNQKRIMRELEAFESDESGYRNLSLNDKLQLILRNGAGENLMSIGFPFPLRSFKLEGSQYNGNASAHLFLRGNSVRKYQKDEIVADLSEVGSVNLQEIGSINDFRDITKKICGSFDDVDYYDPYSFLGDSFIGLHFIQGFIKNHDLSLNQIFSENYSNLDLVGNTRGYIGDVDKKDHVLNVFADLLDNQWDRTKYIVREMTKQGLPSFICGRDLIVDPRSGNIDVYHFDRENVLLSEQNIEDYMNQCLCPFFKGFKNNFNAQKRESDNLIINPFGSESIKSIPVKAVSDLLVHLSEESPKSKVLLLSGFRNNYSHILWNSKLKGSVSDSALDNVIFKNYSSFEEINRDIDRYQVSLGITADTSIAHLFNFVGLKNLTLYNLKRCDLRSPQSLSSDGPLGFCRYGNTQFPVLYNGNLKPVTQGIIEATDYFLGRSQDTQWCEKVYDDNILISSINKKHNGLIVANKKINPVYKIQNA